MPTRWSRSRARRSTSTASSTMTARCATSTSRRCSAAPRSLTAAGQRDPAGKDHDAAVAIERSSRTLVARAWFLFDESQGPQAAGAERSRGGGAARTGRRLRAAQSRPAARTTRTGSTRRSTRSTPPSGCAPTTAPRCACARACTAQFGRTDEAVARSRSRRVARHPRELERDDARRCAAPATGPRGKRRG